MFSVQMPSITIPANGWQPRPHQRPLWRYLESGGKRAVEVAHRRWGKDDVALHWAACAAMTRVGGIWHMLPLFTQARKAIWTAVNPHTGRRRIDEAFPPEIRENTNDHEMFIRFKNGSTWQVIGSDNYDALVGSSVAGIVFSEWALANPASWGYLAPIVAENQGWAMFITTPRGRNHAREMLEMARKDPTWFAEVSTVNDTKAISLEVIEQQRLEYHAIYGEEAGDALIEQEFFCSFTAAILGAYYGKELVRAEQEGRIGTFDVVKELPVHTAWDLGVSRSSDSMTIWFWQIVPTSKGKSQIRIVDYLAGSGYSIAHYAGIIKQRSTERDYKRGTDYVPHDIMVPEMTSSGKDGKAKLRIEVMVECGLKPKKIAHHYVADGISAVRQILPRCVFDERAMSGIECLRQYQTEWDDEKKVFKSTPLNNWAAHGADAFRSLAIGFREAIESTSPEPGRMLAIGDAALPLGVKGATLEDLWAHQRRPSRRI